MRVESVCIFNFTAARCTLAENDKPGICATRMMRTIGLFAPRADVTPQTHFIPPLNQIAFSVVELPLTERGFPEGFGLLSAGGSRIMMRGWLPSMVQGLLRAVARALRSVVIRSSKHAG